MELRFYYNFTEEELKVRLNYSDIASLLRATNATSLEDLNIDVVVEIQFSNGETHKINFIIPETTMMANADELEERSRNRTP